MESPISHTLQLKRFTPIILIITGAITITTIVTIISAPLISTIVSIIVGIVASIIIHWLISKILSYDISMATAYYIENSQNSINALANEISRVEKEILSNNWYARGDTTKVDEINKATITEINRIIDTIFGFIYNIPCVFSVYDSQARFIYVNKLTEDLAYKKELALGKTLYDISPSDNTSEIVKLLKNVIATGISRETQTSIISPGGEELIEKYMINPVYNSKGQVIAAMVVNFDNSDIVMTKKITAYQKIESDSIAQKLREGLSKGLLQFLYEPEPHDESTASVAISYNQISDTLKHAIKFIKSYVDEISQLLQEFSKNNFEVTIKQTYIGDFDTIKHSVDGLIDSVGSLVSEIQLASSQVENGAVTFAYSTNELLMSFERQTEATNYIRESIARLSDKTSENVKEAEKADTLSKEVQAAAHTGNMYMQDMSTAMDAIKQSSNQIIGIVNVIKDISFQTNLLALNASVEAARAGEHGKGFSVVADEVRNLAIRSSNATKETAELLSESINKINSGVETSIQTSEALQNIGIIATKVVDVITTISLSSHEQAKDIAKINDDMEIIYADTTKNNNLLQTNASTSQELSAQSAQLNALVSKFKVKRKYS